MSGYVGSAQPQDFANDYLAMSFLVSQLIGKMATTTLVRVEKVTSNGQLAPVGSIDVMPMIHQVDSDGNPTPHGVIHDVPYFRVQGGTNAFIMDPAVGDIGMALFCSRDLSTVQRTKTPSPPGSARTYDWADALYIGGF